MTKAIARLVGSRSPERIYSAVRRPHPAPAASHAAVFVGCMPLQAFAKSPPHDCAVPCTDVRMVFLVETAGFDTVSAPRDMTQYSGDNTT